MYVKAQVVRVAAVSDKLSCSNGMSTTVIVAA